MIAVPTNNLKSELVQKIGRDKVLEIPSFEDLPLPPELRQTIEKNYSMGFINDALESIKTYAHNSKDNSIFMKLSPSRDSISSFFKIRYYDPCPFFNTP